MYLNEVNLTIEPDEEMNYDNTIGELICNNLLMNITLKNIGLELFCEFNDTTKQIL